MDEGLGIGRQGGAQADERVVQPGSGCPRGDLEELGDLHEGQTEVVMEHEDRTLLDVEPAERPLQLVTVDDPVGSVGDGRSIDRQYPDVRRPLPRPL